MGDAIFGLVSGISLGGALVWLLSATIFARLFQKCHKLEVAVQDLQDRALSVKGREASEKRWAKRDIEELEMAKILQSPRPETRKYDNDPLGSL